MNGAIPSAAIRLGSDAFRFVGASSFSVVILLSTKCLCRVCRSGDRCASPRRAWHRLAAVGCAAVQASAVTLARQLRSSDLRLPCGRHGSGDAAPQRRRDLRAAKSLIDWRAPTIHVEIYELSTARPR